MLVEPQESEIASALRSLAHEVKHLGNAGAVNAGEGGQGAIEVLGFKIEQGFERLSSAIEDLASAIREGREESAD